MDYQTASSRGVEIEITEYTKECIKFTLTGADVSVANSLRRIMLSEIPTLAIDLVLIQENSSVLHDEFLAHRLGLLPIDSDQAADFKMKTECSCQTHCMNCTVEYSLDVTCTTDEPTVITHHDLKPMRPKCPLPMPSRDASNPDVPGIVITKLKKNQTLKLTAQATKGNGLIHSKWIPATTAVFQHEADIQLNRNVLDNLTTEQKEQFVNSCPTNVYNLVHSNNSKTVVNIADNRRCTFCNECVAYLKDLNPEYKDAIKIKAKKDIFHFIVESSGAMDSSAIVKSAFRILRNKLKTVKENVSKVCGLVSRDNNDDYLPTHI